MKVSNNDTFLQTLISLDYTIEPILYDTYILLTCSHVALPASKTN